MKTIKIKLTTIIFSLILGMTLSGCSTNEGSSGKDNTQEEHSGHNHKHEATEEDSHSEALHAAREGLAENEVLITKKQMEAADIKLGKVTRQQLSKVVKSFGELVLAPSDEATVNALIGGIVDNIRFIEGDYVGKGQTIARIVHPNIVDMQQAYLEALNQNEYLEAEYQRQKRLQEDSVNAEKTVQNAKATYQSNLAKMQSLKKKLRLININPDDLTPQNIQDGYVLKAPISGYIAKVKVNTGSHVSPQQSLFHITANQKAHIDLNVYEKDISKVAQGQKITFNLANNPTTKPMEGEVMKMAKRFDSEQRTALVHASIKDMKENLLPGMSVIAYIQTGENKQNTLPEAAFVADQGKDYVFLLKRTVKTNDKHTGDKEHAHQSDEKQAEHTGHANNNQPDNAHFYIFEKVQVDKGVTQRGFSGFTSDKENMIKFRFAINNAQALLSELKKGGSGHSGHAH